MKNHPSLTIAYMKELNLTMFAQHNFFAGNKLILFLKNDLKSLQQPRD